MGIASTNILMQNKCRVVRMVLSLSPNSMLFLTLNEICQMNLFINLVFIYNLSFKNRELKRYKLCFELYKPFGGFML